MCMSKTKRQARVTDFYQVTHRSGRVFCSKCKRIFISIYHLYHHQENFCRYAEKRPFLSLEILNEEILVEIARFLPLKSLLSLIKALPRLLLAHGMKSVWDRTFLNDRMVALFRCDWMKKNLRMIRSVDYFLIARDQGRYRRNSVHARTYAKQYCNRKNHRENRRTILWSRKSKSVGCFCPSPSCS